MLFRQPHTRKQHYVITERIRKAPKHCTQSKAWNIPFGVFLEAGAPTKPQECRGGRQLPEQPCTAPQGHSRHSGSSVLPSADYSIKNKYLLSLSNGSHTRHMCINQYVMWTSAFITGARNVSSVKFFLCFPTFYCTKVRDSRRDAGKTFCNKAPQS